jgi:uncharacterized membrane protein
LIGLFAIFAITPLLVSDVNGADLGWFERVDATGASEWLQRLLVNGTYPVLPWFALSTLGAILAESKENQRLRLRIIQMGGLTLLASIILSVRNGTAWALTEGDAVLTFFPASVFFVFITTMFVFIAHEVLLLNAQRGFLNLSFLEASGRLTLTIYVLHFAVLGLAASYMMGQPKLALIPAFTITFVHTLAWIPLANLHQKHCPNISLEALLRQLSN